MMYRRYGWLSSVQCLNLQQLSSVKIWFLVSEVTDPGSNEKNEGWAGLEIALRAVREPCRKLTIKWVIGFSVRTLSASWDRAISMDERGMEDPEEEGL